MDVSPEWLTQRVEDAPTSYASGLPDRAALRIRMAWQRVKSHACDGDEVWAFETPPSAWRKVGKLNGYAIVREGVVVESVVTP